VPTAVTERWGSLSATGVAKEANFGTAVTPTSFLPQTGNNLALDPGLFFPKLQWGQRDTNVFGLYGQNKNSGSLTGPLFPSNGAALVVAAIGADGAAGSGVTGSSPTNSTTLSALSTAGATTVTLTSATGYAVGNFVQIDVNNTVGPTTSEVRKISSITTNTLTLDAALVYGHASGAAVSKVVAPFTHTITQSNTLPSLTVEKNLGGFESLQFSGARVNKLSLSAQVGNQEVGCSYDMIAKHVGVLPTPSAISIVNEDPFVFAEASLSLFGQTVAQAETVQLDIENGLKDTYTMNQSHDLQFLTPVTRHIAVKSDVVFTSLDDATWGYFNQMVNQNVGAFAFSLTHPNNGGTWTFNLPAIQIKTYSDAVPFDDIIKSTLNLEASYDFTTSKTISATLVNSVYLAY
jgi:hypothetical protein